MLLASVRRHVVERGLLPRGARVLVAVSGGGDSLALLYALARLRGVLAVELEAATVHHGLRVEADSECRWALEHAGRLGIVAHRVDLHLDPARATQDLARDARYEALRTLASARECSRIAVGHTRDDQAETVLDRLLRGSGVRGLVGIEWHREDGVVRPLLGCSRAETRAFLASCGVEPRTDPSNFARRYRRVRLREELLPRLAVESPSVTSHLADLAEDAAEIRRMIETAAGSHQVVPGQPLLRHPLLDLPRPVRLEILRRWAAPGGPLGRAQLTALDDTLLGKGEALLKGGVRVRIEEEFLVRVLPDET